MGFASLAIGHRLLCCKLDPMVEREELVVVSSLGLVGNMEAVVVDSLELL